MFDGRDHYVGLYTMSLYSEITGSVRFLIFIFGNILSSKVSIDNHIFLIISKKSGIPSSVLIAFQILLYCQNFMYSFIYHLKQVIAIYNF